MMTVRMRPTRILLLACVITLGIGTLVGSGGGSSSSGGGGETEDAGGITYVKSFGAPGAEQSFNHMTTTRDGGAVMVGYVQTAQQDDGTFSRGLAVTRVDGAGDVVWSRTYGEFEAQDFQLREFGPAVPAPDGGVVVVGLSDDGPSLVKLDGNGRFQWQRHYPQRGRVNIHSLVRTSAGNYVMAGDIEGNERFDAFLLATTGDGTQSALLTDFDSESGDPESIYAVREGPGVLVITGIRDGDQWIAEVDPVSLVPVGIDNTGDVGMFDVLPGVNSRYITAGLAGLDQDGGEVTVSNPVGRVHGIDDQGNQKWFARLEDPPPGGDDTQPTLILALAADTARGLIVAAGNTLDEFGHGLTGHLVGLREPAEPILYPPALAHSIEFDFDFNVLNARTLVADVAVTADGDYIVAGTFAFFNHDRLEPWVARIDGSTRTFEWRQRLWLQAPGCTKRLPLDPFPTVIGITVHALPDGGILYSSPSCLVKLDASGSVLWGAINTPRDDAAHRVLELSDGGFLVLGSRRPANAEQPSPWILRLDDEGQLVWSWVLTASFGERMGLDMLGQVTDAIEHEDGVLVVGRHLSTAADEMFADPWIARLDADGRPVFAQVYIDLGEVNEWSADETEPRISMQGDVVAAILGNRVLARLDPDTGELIWVRVLERAGFDPLSALRDLEVLTDGSIAVTGRVPAPVTAERPPEFRSFVPFIARIEADATVRWANLYGGTLEALSFDGEGVAVTGTADGGLAVAITNAFRPDTLASCNVLAALSDTLASACTDMILLKIDADGAPVFARVFGTATSESATALATTADNGFLMTGRSDGYAFPRFSGFAVRTDADGRVNGSCPAGLDEEVDVTGFPITLELVEPDGFEVGFELRTADQEAIAGENALEVARSCAGVSQSPVLTVAVTGEGVVRSEPAGISCGLGETDCEQAFPLATRVALDATPAEGQTFIGWGGSCASFGSRSSIEVTLNESLACEAEFSANEPEPPPTGEGPFTLTVTVVGNGEVLSLDEEGPGQSLLCFGDDDEETPPVVCSVSYPAGTLVRLRPISFMGAPPESPHALWEGCDSVEDPDVCAVQMSGNRNVVAIIQGGPPS